MLQQSLNKKCHICIYSYLVCNFNLSTIIVHYNVATILDASITGRIATTLYILSDTITVALIEHAVLSCGL